MKTSTAMTVGMIVGFSLAAITGAGWAVSFAQPAPKAQEKPKPASQPTPQATPAIPSIYVMSPAAQAIDQALDRPVSFDFDETPLVDVIEFLRDFTNINIILDKNGLDNAAVPEDTPITLSLKQVSMRNALRLMLSPHDLAFIVRHDVLLVTDRDFVSSVLEARVYPVADLVVVASSEAHEMMAEEFMQLLRTTVAPDSWEKNGGAGSVCFHETTVSLSVMQSQDVHEQVDLLLTLLRGARSQMSHWTRAGELPAPEVLWKQMLSRRLAEAESVRKAQAEAASTAEKSVVYQTAVAKQRRLEAQAQLAELQAEVARQQLRNTPANK